jgi:anti-sigma regulatory factor (Ser/Thr protein kinase)
MNKKQTRRQEIQDFIVSHVQEHPSDIAKLAADRFGITRQAIHKHLRRLTDEGVIIADGNTRNRVYRSALKAGLGKVYQVADKLSESSVWMTDVRPLLEHLPENVLDIWRHAFTEIFNNAIEHANGTRIQLMIVSTTAATEIWILDNGVGIFAKIKAALDLDDERHAVLELSKGKFTTAPDAHSGEGVFFTSRMFDQFDINSGDVHLSHEFEKKGDWIIEHEDCRNGTSVRMNLANQTSRTTTEVFDEFASGEDYSFSKTVVPVRLAQYGDDKLVSRSQAKRLLAGLHRFEDVILDFAGVDDIGQAFADEVFRVFPSLHPEIEVAGVNANADVQRMISRARSVT